MISPTISVCGTNELVGLRIVRPRASGGACVLPLHGLLFLEHLGVVVEFLLGMGDPVDLFLQDHPAKARFEHKLIVLLQAWELRVDLVHHVLMIVPPNTALEG